MNGAFGSMALHYEINEKGEIRLTGNRYNESGGGSPNSGNNGSSNNSGFGCAAFAAIVTMIVCIFSGFGFFASLIFSILSVFAAKFIARK